MNPLVWMLAALPWARSPHVVWNPHVLIEMHDFFHSQRIYYLAGKMRSTWLKQFLAGAQGRKSMGGYERQEGLDT